MLTGNVLNGVREEGRDCSFIFQQNKTNRIDCHRHPRIRHLHHHPDEEEQGVDVPCVYIL